VRKTWKLCDLLPEEPATAETSIQPVTAVGSHAELILPRVRLLLTERFQTNANNFGISSLFKRRPVKMPDTLDLEAVYTPAVRAKKLKQPRRPIQEIIAPFPNLSSWLFGAQFWLGGKKSKVEREDLQNIITRPDFNPSDLVGVDFKKIDEQLASSSQEFAAGEGWKKTSIRLGIPSAQKSTKAFRKAASTAERRTELRETMPDEPAKKSILGDIFTVDGFWHKDLCTEIKAGLETDPGANHFVYDPSLLSHNRPNSSLPSKTEAVYGELYNSPAFLKEDLRLHNSPAEPGCNLPRAIVGLMFASDAMLVTQFGDTKLWPGYMYFGNQSKYERTRPTYNAAHHIALFPSVRTLLQVIS
jgi:hypothetical protein